MQVYDAKNIRHYDKLAEKRRKRFILKILFFIGLAMAIVGFLLYLLFFSGLLEIKDVSVSGLNKVGGDEFNEELNERLNSKWLGLVEHQKNVLFFDSDAFMAEILSAFPEIENMSVKREPPHTLNIGVMERATAGIWCFVDGCKYFDKEGVSWGGAAKSSGFLILIVDDLGPNIKEINRELLSGIMFILERLKKDEIFINKFIIPDKFIGDFSAFTSGGYELLFSADSDIRRQLEVLEIFLAEKKDNPPPAGGFKPQYIDLRINGRVYHK